MAKQSICIDLGHCETAASCPQNVNGKPTVITLDTADGNKQVIPTQIILTYEQMEKLRGKKRPSYKELKAICGETPFQIGNCPAYVENGERFIYFKVAPKDFDNLCDTSDKAREYGITHGCIMACYIYALVENILKFNVDKVSGVRSDFQLLIGCPTTKDWTAMDNMKEYADLAKTATEVSSVKIIPESRAAMFSALDSGVNKGVSAQNGALIFDFGSSTADCTYMLLGKKLMEFSWTLGASAVEINMTLVAHSIAAAGGEFEAENILGVADLLREKKQDYYNGLINPTNSDVICAFERKDKTFKKALIEITPEFMDKATKETPIVISKDSNSTATGSWQELCKAFFEQAKQTLEREKITNENGEEISCPVANIVITGGASKMSFIEPLCREVFSQNDVTIIVNTVDPSHTVSRGLGWIALTDSKIFDCQTAIKEELKKNVKSDELSTKVRDGIFDLIKEIAKDEIDKWAALEGDTATVADLEKSLNAAIKNDVIKDKMKAIYSEAMADWENKVSDELTKAVNTQVENLYSDKVSGGLILPKDFLKELDSALSDEPSVDISKMLDNVDFGSVTNSVSRFITQSIIWAIAIILAPETLGLSIFIGFIAAAFADGAMSDNDKAKPRDKALRGKIAAQLPAKLQQSKNEIMQKFNDGFSAEFAKNFDIITEKAIKNAVDIVTLKRFGK